MRGGHVLRHVAHLQVVDETPEEEQEACGGGGEPKRVQRWISIRGNKGKTLTQQQEDPPEPVLPVKVAGKVIGKLDKEEKSSATIGNAALLAAHFLQNISLRQTYPDNEDPFDEGEAEAADGAVASRDGVGQAEGQAEPDPVEEEGH